MNESVSNQDNSNQERNLAEVADQTIVRKEDLLDGVSKEQILAIRQSRRTETFLGPIPPPNVLEKYNNIIPDGAHRILTMAEQQQLHRQSMEKTVIESDVRRSDRGLILGFIITLLLGGGGIYLVAIGKDLNGLAIIFGSLATLAGTFVYSQESRKKERIQKSKTISEKNS
jgi:uncharacterized membrane protein